MNPTAEKFCSVCKQKNPIDAKECVYCGTSMDGLVQPSQTTVEIQKLTTTLPQTARRLKPLTPNHVPESGLAIFIISDLKPLAVLDKEEIILGRQTSEVPSNIFDLSPYGAFEMGVSRQHAIIHKTPGGYEITDLNSSNGTRIDEQKLVPNQAYPLKASVQVHLGKMILYLVHKPVEGD